MKSMIVGALRDNLQYVGLWYTPIMPLENSDTTKTTVSGSLRLVGIVGETHPPLETPCVFSMKDSKVGNEGFLDYIARKNYQISFDTNGNVSLAVSPDIEDDSSVLDIAVTGLFPDRIRYFRTAVNRLWQSEQDFFPILQED